MAAANGRRNDPLRDHIEGVDLKVGSQGTSTKAS
jgi:hypothetical protein